jgi:Ca2+:H+ antiporter
VSGAALTQKLSVALAVLLVVEWVCCSRLERITKFLLAGSTRRPSNYLVSIRLALITLAVVTALVALVSEIFVDSVQKPAETFLGGASTKAEIQLLGWALVGISVNIKL